MWLMAYLQDIAIGELVNEAEIYALNITRVIYKKRTLEYIIYPIGALGSVREAACIV